MTIRAWLAAILVCVGIATPAAATTKGLSQIVTPDIQPEGQLSLSFQLQSKQIANPYEFQAELGFTRWFEAAVFQGVKPEEQIFGTLLGLVQQEPYLLSAGFINWSTRGQKPQPFLEAGYYGEHDKFMGGPIQVDKKTEVMAGWAHDFDRHWRVQLDFQSGSDNFSTAGFTYTLNDSFQFNPAIYVSNQNPPHVYGYVVFTFTLPLWQGYQPRTSF